MFRRQQAILTSHWRFVLALILDLIVHTYSQWPSQFGVVFSQPPVLSVSNHLSTPAITVVLCVERIQVNTLVFDVEAFRLRLSFPGLMRPFVFYCPRQILAPGYVRRTLEESLKEELAAWIIRRPQVHSLMVEYVKNLQRKMRLLLSHLPAYAFILHLPPNTLVGPTITVRFGSSQVSVVSTDLVKIVITTNDGYSISYECPRELVPSPATLKANLLQPYLAAV